MKDFTKSFLHYQQGGTFLEAIIENIAGDSLFRKPGMVLLRVLFVRVQSVLEDIARPSIIAVKPTIM